VKSPLKIGKFDAAARFEFLSDLKLKRAVAEKTQGADSGKYPVWQLLVLCGFAVQRGFNETIVRLAFQVQLLEAGSSSVHLDSRNHEEAFSSRRIWSAMSVGAFIDVTRS
jgi:hypothetical protein